MCQFEYRYYESCSHRVIEVVQYCPSRKYSAGLSGVLEPCLETKYKTFDRRKSGDMWYGMSGTCDYCLQKQGGNFIPIGFSPVEPTGRNIPMKRNKKTSQTKQGPRPKDSMSPKPSDDPKFCMHRLEVTLPELLGFRSQLDDRTAALFEAILFPGKSVQYKTYSNKWTCQIKSVESHPEEWYFLTNGGLLAEDRKRIDVWKTCKGENEIWEEYFKPRGMTLNEFQGYCDKKEVTCQSGSVAANFYARFITMHTKFVQRKIDEVFEAAGHVEGVGALQEIAETLAQSTSWHSETGSNGSQETSPHISDTQDETQFIAPSRNLNSSTQGQPTVAPTSSADSSAPFSYDIGHGEETQHTSMGQPNVSNTGYLSGQMENSDASNALLDNFNQVQALPGVEPLVFDQVDLDRASREILSSVGGDLSFLSQPDTLQTNFGPITPPDEPLNGAGQDGFVIKDQGPFAASRVVGSVPLQTPTSQTYFVPGTAPVGQRSIDVGNQNMLSNLGEGVPEHFPSPAPLSGVLDGISIRQLGPFNENGISLGFHDTLSSDGSVLNQLTSSPALIGGSLNLQPGLFNDFSCHEKSSGKVISQKTLATLNRAALSPGMIFTLDGEGQGSSLAGLANGKSNAVIQGGLFFGQSPSLQQTLAQGLVYSSGHSLEPTSSASYLEDDDVNFDDFLVPEAFEEDNDESGGGELDVAETGVAQGDIEMSGTEISATHGDADAAQGDVELTLAGESEALKGKETTSLLLKNDFQR